MLKLLVVMPCYQPAIYYGGPISAVHEMNKALVKSGIDVTVFTTNANGKLRLNVPLEQEVKIDGVKVFYYPLSFAGSYFYAPKLSKSLKTNLHIYDVVHINWLYVYTTVAAAAECIRQNIPYILTPHGMLDSYSISLKGSLKKKLYIACIEKRNIKNAHAIHYSSAGEKEEAFISRWNIDDVIVPNIIDLPSKLKSILDEVSFYAEYPFLKHKSIVVSMGRLNYIKGLDQLLKSWNMVIAAVPNAHLIIAGPDSNGYIEVLKRIVKSEGISASVSFLGTVIGDRKSGLLYNSDVFVSSSYLESFGMAIVEAMAHGLPVAITDKVNIKSEIVEAEAGLISSCEPISISNNLIYLLENKNIANQMGIRGIALVRKKFDLNSVVRKMKEIYIAAIESNRPS